MKPTNLTVLLEKYNKECFYAFLSISLFSRVLSDISLGRLKIHSGDLFPLRHLPAIPLFPIEVLFLEWFLLIMGSFLILFRRKKGIGTFMAWTGMILSLSQMFQNQKILIGIVLSVLLFFDPYKSQMGRFFLRWQLIFVYFFSALSKLLFEFSSGLTLQQLSFNFTSLPKMPLGFYQAIAWAVILTEFGIPILLMRKSALGLSAVVILHLGFAFLMPDIWPFTFIMLGLACLFYGDSSATRSTSTCNSSP